MRKTAFWPVSKWISASVGWSLLVLPVLVGCGGNTEDQTDRVIASETQVTDVRISEADPDGTYANEIKVTIGMQEGKDSRLLLYFPNIGRLYQDDVVISSITDIEVAINCPEVLANPGQIRLYPITQSWTGFATWHSRARIFSDYDWASPGGDFDASVYATPAVRVNSDNPEIKQLTFDVTEMVTTMVGGGQPNYGFILAVEPSQLNGADAMDFVTYNHTTSTLHPQASLVYSTKDVMP